MSTIEKPVVCVSATIRKQVDPDIAEFNIWFEGYGQDQASCAEQYTADVKSMKCALSQFGLEDKLRMSDYYSYANRNRRNRASRGFEYSVRGVLRMRRAEHDVSSVWTALANCDIKARINIRFLLEDEDTEESKLLVQAFAKARNSAEALAAASSKRLGEVKQIRYNRQGDEFATPGWCFLEPSAQNSGTTTDINPEPINVECSVDVDWWLE